MRRAAPQRGRQTRLWACWARCAARTPPRQRVEQAVLEHEARAVPAFLARLDMNITEPGSCSRRSQSARAAPASMATWASWPQACIAPSCCEANDRPVSSSAAARPCRRAATRCVRWWGRAARRRGPSSRALRGSPAAGRPARPSPWRWSWGGRGRSRARREWRAEAEPHPPAAPRPHRPSLGARRVRVHGQPRWKRPRVVLRHEPGPSRSPPSLCRRARPRLQKKHGPAQIPSRLSGARLTETRAFYGELLGCPEGRSSTTGSTSTSTATRSSPTWPRPRRRRRRPMRSTAKTCRRGISA